jgi:hypothetical protein
LYGRKEHGIPNHRQYVQRYGQCSRTMKNCLFFLILGLIPSACIYTESTDDKQTLDFKYFTIVVPKSWAKINGQGQDSYVGRIKIDGKDTLDFDLGWYSNDLAEFKRVEKDGKFYYSIIDYNSNGIKLLDSAEMEKAKKCIISWQKVDGYITKFVIPRNSGSGLTGVYIDSLWKTGSDYDRFNLFGTDLSVDNEKAFLSAVKTIKFMKRKEHSP